MNKKINPGKKEGKYLKKILDQAIKKITPKNKKAILKIFEELKNRLESSAKKIDIKADIFLGGSLSKGTMLSNNNEFDIFVRFGKQHRNEELSAMLESILKESKIKYKRVHGSRDYFQSEFKDIKAEFIPIYKIKDSKEAANITDISPLHVLWVKKHIKKMDKDVMLAKQFCKAMRIYGAESHIQGFSGYLLEILIIHYKGFVNFLHSASKWAEKTIIDTAKHYKSETEILRELNKAKQTSPLIVIDPVQKERNVAAAVNQESYSKLIFSANEFLSKPDEKYFVITEISEEMIIKETNTLECHLVHIAVIAKGDHDDIIGSKVRKFKDFLEHELVNLGFEIMHSYWDLSNIWLLFNPERLPETTFRQGPLLFNNDENCKRFKEKHKDVFVKGKFLCAYVENKERNMIKLIEQIYGNYKLSHKDSIELVAVEKLV